MSRKLAALLWLCASLAAGLAVARAAGLWAGVAVLAVAPVLAWLSQIRSAFQHCDFPVRFTPLAACALSQGQMALRLLRLHSHPFCTILTLRAHDPGQSRKESRLILWRHQYSAEQYRRMTLVLRWLGSKEHHE